MIKQASIAVLGALLLTAIAPVAEAGLKPSFDFEWYGSFKLDGAYDQTRTSHGNFVMYVLPGEDNSQFSMTANQTMIGLNAKGKNFDKVTVMGNLEMDLYGAASEENNPALVIRSANFSILSGNTRLLAGQSADIVSPLTPSTLNYTVLWGCGNYQYRRPQVSLFQTLDLGPATQAVLAGGIFRNIGYDIIELSLATAGDSTDGDEDGSDAAMPSVQGRLDIFHGLMSGAQLRIGVSGQWGQMKAESNSGNIGTYPTWMGAGHLMLSLPSGTGIAGEYHEGVNTARYQGAILNQNTFEGVRSYGGWASAWILPSAKIKVSAGIGFDNVKAEDIADGARSNNQCVYGNCLYTIVPGAFIGVELSQWQTKYKNAGIYSSLRAQTAFILDFK